MKVFNRPFGVEIECETDGRGIEGTKILLNRNNLRRWSRISYDGSEIEVKSPILKGKQGLVELKTVMELLRKNGYHTGEEDGMHVHFDVSDLTVKDLIRIIQSWNHNHNNIEMFLDDVRVGNEYCGKYPEKQDYRDYSGVHLENLSEENIRDFDGQKMFNVEPRFSLHTLELRQHHGTLNYEDAEAWILFGQAFIRYVAKRKTPINKLTIEQLLKYTKTYKSARENLVKRVNSKRVVVQAEAWI
jgi:hypothetical protein